MFNNHSPFLSEFLQEVQSLLLPQTPSLTWTACSWSLYFPGLLWPSWHPPSVWGDAKGRRLWMSHLQTRVCTLEHSLVLGQVSKTAPAILGHRAGKRHEHWLSVTSLCVCAQSCLTLCNPIGCSLPGFSVHGVSQARILEWVAISFSRGSSWPRDWTCVSCIGRRVRYCLSHSESL